MYEQNQENRKLVFYLLMIKAFQSTPNILFWFDNHGVAYLKASIFASGTTPGASA